MDLKAELTAYALDAGFAGIGICSPHSFPELPDRLQSFLDADFHGQMSWMSERTHWRADPSALWPEAKSVIMLAETYTPDHDPLEVLDHADKAAISVYAHGRDYHDVVKRRLKRVGRWLIEKAGDDTQVKVFVDTAPIMEKPLAQAAGLGWQGKHTNLLSRDLGNWFFLGAIFTTVELAPDEPEAEHCGSCRACLDVCPTDAFPAPFQLDARRCISYLTIEHKGPVDHALRPLMGNRIYGCDDCLAVCPWNKFAQSGRDARLASRPDLADMSLAELATLDDKTFRAMFAGTAIKRIGRDRFVRNVTYAIGNSGLKELEPSLEPLVTDKDETVAEAARWALAQLKET